MVTVETTTSNTTPSPAPLLTLGVPPKGSWSFLPSCQRIHIRLSDLTGIGKVVAVQGPVAQDAPPAFDQIQPGSASGEKVEVKPGMAQVPQESLDTVVNGEVIDNHCPLASGKPLDYFLHELYEGGTVPMLTVMQQPLPGVGIEGAKEPEEPPPSILRLIMRVMGDLGPLASGGIKLGSYRPLLVHADHRAPRWGIGVETHNLPLFSGNSGSGLTSQERALRHQRMPPWWRILPRCIWLMAMPSCWAAFCSVARVQWQPGATPSRTSSGRLWARKISFPRASSVNTRRLPERGLSSRALRPSSLNRLRSFLAVSEVTPTILAALAAVWPWAMPLRSRARCTWATGAVRAEHSLSISFISSSVGGRMANARIRGLLSHYWSPVY